MLWAGFFTWHYHIAMEDPASPCPTFRLYLINGVVFPLLRDVSCVPSKSAIFQVLHALTYSLFHLCSSCFFVGVSMFMAFLSVFLHIFLGGVNEIQQGLATVPTISPAVLHLCLAGYQHLFPEQVDCR